MRVLHAGPRADDGSNYANVIQAGVIASVFWGIAGFWLASSSRRSFAFPNIFYFEVGMDNFGRLPAAPVR